MGFLVYDDTHAVHLEDRTLAHLQIVVIDKLRRKEKFALNLVDNRSFVTMWLNACTPLMFVYEGNRQPHINVAWVELLAGEASLTGVLELLPEPAEQNPAARAGSLAGNTRGVVPSPA